MFTKQIKLERVSAEEFERLKENWATAERIKARNDYFEMLSTICSPGVDIDSYENLIHTLIEHPYAYKIAVREGDNWHRPYAKDLNDKQIGDLAKFAFNDSKKTHYLELKLKIDHWHREEGTKEQATFEFGESHGDIVCYQVKIPKELTKLIDMNSDPSKKINFGLWNPNHHDYIVKPK